MPEGRPYDCAGVSWDLPDAEDAGGT